MIAEGNSIHDGNVGRLESGDRVQFKKGEWHREDQADLPTDFEATVSRTILNSRHGKRIVTFEKFGENDENDFYLNDDWIITLIPTAKLPEKGEN